ncbi:hypothetical protein Rleg10DRAFT_3689 [Rhizobium leguminosarum bv. trifolii WSM2012]|nr:hypothetical protein Rleg10DRAFT_3689 [Rhizobium leguminosarum bv. trifolii WSM2012]
MTDAFIDTGAFEVGSSAPSAADWLVVRHCRLAGLCAKGLTVGAPWPAIASNLRVL